jgi:general secretion pathway protein G
MERMPQQNGRPRQRRADGRDRGRLLQIGRRADGRDSARPLQMRRRAFTLIEFIVVMTIIGILAALIVPRFVGRVGGAKQAVAQQKVAVLETKVLEFQTDCGRFPTAQEGLRALLQAPADVGSNWKGPYVKQKDIIDPWGTEIMYRYPGKYNADFDLFTYGADHQEGGESENADIGNW